MISDEIQNKIKKWAKNEPLVYKAYVFGSRARIDFNEESDLDIAVEIRKCPSDGNVFGTWIGEGKKLKKRLSKAVPEYNIDLQWCHKEFSKIVFEGVNKSSFVIYVEDE